MILKIRNWCEELIIAIVLCIIIECLIPDGNNKKYAKVVIGIYIMFVTINPILNLLNYEINFDEIFNVKYEETYSSLDYDVKDVYIIGIEETIKEEIIELGYQVEEVNISLDINYENIEKIEIGILQDKNNQKELNTDYQDIFGMLKQNYFVEKENIVLTFK